MSGLKYIEILLNSKLINIISSLPLQMSQIGSAEKGPLSHTTFSTLGRRTLSATEDRLFELPKMKCKICLSQTNPQFMSNENYIKPCKCRGAQQYAHQACMTAWLNKLIKDRQETGVQIEKINCELCNQEVSFECQNKVRCLKQSERSRKLQENWPILLIYSIIITICSGALAWVVYTYCAATKLTGKQKQTLIAVTAATSIIVPVCVLMCIYKLVSIFLIKRQKSILEIKSKPCKMEIRQKMSQNFNNSINPETQSELIKRKVKIVVNEPKRNKNISEDYLVYHQNLPQRTSLAPQTFFF